MMRDRGICMRTLLMRLRMSRIKPRNVMTGSATGPDGSVGCACWTADDRKRECFG